METQATSGKKEKVNFLFPTELNKRANSIAKELGFTYSDLVRQALAEFIDKIDRKKIDSEIAEACAYFYDKEKKLAQEWRATETRISHVSKR